MIARPRPAALAVAVLLALMLGGTYRAWRAPALRAAPAPAAAAPARPPSVSLAGNAACGGLSCHGGLTARADPDHPGQNEQSLWYAHDRHVGAFRTLVSPRAERMADNLAPTNPDGKRIPAAEDVRCLACHATPQAAALPESPLKRPLLAGGVGCEACHGPARGAAPWLHAHYGPDFVAARSDPQKRAALYAAHGMTYLPDLGVQARVCAGCHVGAPAGGPGGAPVRDAFHDIMAAGHPRLTFELTAFRDNLPPHWRTAKYQADPTYEPRSWALGQVETARAAVHLLEDRVRRGEQQRRPWPEFGEYDCFSCHASLRNPSWRRTVLYTARGPDHRPAPFAYSVWQSTLLADVTPHEDLPVQRAFAALADTMSRPYWKRDDVPAKAAGVLAALAGLEKTVRATKYDEAAAKAIRSRLARRLEKVEGIGWEEATQLLLATYALGADPARQEAAQALAPLLSFDGGDSPAEFRRPPLEQPGAAKDARQDLNKQVNEALTKLRDALRK